MRHAGIQKYLEEKDSIGLIEGYFHQLNRWGTVSEGYMDYNRFEFRVCTRIWTQVMYPEICAIAIMIPKNMIEIKVEEIPDLTFDFSITINI